VVVVVLCLGVLAEVAEAVAREYRRLLVHSEGTAGVMVPHHSTPLLLHLQAEGVVSVVGVVALVRPDEARRPRAAKGEVGWRSLWVGTGVAHPWQETLRGASSGEARRYPFGEETIAPPCPSFFI